MNPLKRRLDEGRTALGFLVSMPSVQLTQILAAGGADWLSIDLEHGPIDNATVQAIRALGRHLCRVIFKMLTHAGPLKVASRSERARAPRLGLGGGHVLRLPFP